MSEAACKVEVESKVEVVVEVEEEAEAVVVGGVGMVIIKVLCSNVVNLILVQLVGFELLCTYYLFYLQKIAEDIIIGVLEGNEVEAEAEAEVGDIVVSSYHLVGTVSYIMPRLWCSSYCTPKKELLYRLYKVVN